MDIIFYSVFSFISIFIYKDQIIKSIMNIKKDYSKNIFVTLIFILATMVISAILLSYCGIGERANQKEISNDISTNVMITLIVVILIGPFVEEVVFRGVIYAFLRGKERNVIRCIVANVITSLIFAIYHCDMWIFLELDINQVLSVIPLFLWVLD